MPGYSPFHCCSLYDSRRRTSSTWSAAVTAARLGHRVALVEYHRHLGGMSASGLGKSDIETREAIGGMFREFVERVYQYYVRKYGAGSENVKLCRDGYYYEPSVAERPCAELVAEQTKIRVMKNRRLEDVSRQGKRVTGIRVKDRSSRVIEESRAKLHRWDVRGRPGPSISKQDLMQIPLCRAALNELRDVLLQ
ncbi:MAG: FAD-dependent oxidoreductase [Bryobacteraceae bacterium]